MKRFKSVGEYIDSHIEKQEELILLREILLATEVVETVKWGAPIYTVNGKNIAGLGAFKNFTAIWFFQGVLLNDPKMKLINAQEGKTQALRQWRFGSPEEIKSLEKLIKDYINEAIANQQQGREIKARTSKPLIVPEELKSVFENRPAVEKGFESFSLTRKREFTDYIHEAKREETKQKRLDKIITLIIGGIGLHDKYR